MLQGFSTGGEYGGAATFMAEYAPDDRRGFYGSFLEFGTLAGFSFGAALMLGYSLHLGVYPRIISWASERCPASFRASSMSYSASPRAIARLSGAMMRSEERRVGKECVSTGRSRGPPSP